MQGYIYFLRDPVLPTAIKIGWSGDPVTRCRAINNRLKRNEVALVAWFPGTMADERALHRRWERYRVLGEWFRPAPEIVAALDLCAAVHGGAA